MIGADHAHELFQQQPLVAELPFQVLAVADGEVDLAAAQVLRHGRVLAGDHVQLDPGGGAREVIQQPGEDHRVAVVAHGQAETVLGVGVVEQPLLGERMADQRERLADGAGELTRARRRGHAPGLAYEQRVMEELAQAVECVAGRGLAHLQACCRTGDAALMEHGVEDDQEVEIHSPEIH
ncbi:hypothetical protein KBTX_04366 [wastewater metagenome]|uniref:Uncharacterized protein n=2 Tax=unclassified sequences TaxID=12908 RepID=A0A5B8RJ10_9ZZZZ|nr:hypothetical protein KBTEX_04366 [uncultured organism]